VIDVLPGDGPYGAKHVVNNKNIFAVGIPSWTTSQEEIGTAATC